MQQVNVAIIGFGYWGPNLLRNFAEDERVSLSYVCDLQPMKLEKLKRQHPTVKLTTDYQEILRDPAVKAIAIATPVFAHYRLAHDALMANKHVLVEKPMCTTSEECKELVAIAAKKERILMVDHTFIYHGAVRQLKAVLDQKELGEILYFNSTRVNLGLFQNDINVIWDLASHDLAIMDYLIAQTPKAVHAIGACHVNGGIEDIAYITLIFDNNFIAHFHVSWLAPVKVRQILIGGTKKMLVYDDLSLIEKVRIYDKGISIEQPKSDKSRYENLIKYRIGDVHSPVVDPSEALKTEVAHFIDCVITGEKPLTDGEAGLRVVRILESAARSLKTGQATTLVTA